MTDTINTKRVSPVKETRRYEIEVYLSYTKGIDEPFVTAGVVGAAMKAFIPNGDIVERFIFEAERPEEES